MVADNRNPSIQEDEAREPKVFSLVLHKEFKTGLRLHDDYPSLSV